MAKTIFASVESIASRFDIPIENVIEVIFERIDSGRIAAADRVSEIKPLSYKPTGGTEFDRIYDDEAVKQFRDFCKTVVDFVEERAEILGDSYSPKSESYYFAFFTRNADGSVRERFMFFIRMSDHKLPEHHKEFEEKMREQMWQMHKAPGTSLTDGIRQFDILVNGRKYTSYDGALVDIKKRLSAFLKRNK